MAAQDKRRVIIDALIDLMEAQPLEEIRVEDLLSVSGVSKTTFYRLFHDKYDVMNSAYLDAAAAVVRADLDMREQKEWCIEDLELVSQHPRFYQKILSYKGQNSFRDTIRDFYKQNICRHMEIQTGGAPMTDRERYAVDAYAEVGAHVMVWFIMNSSSVSPEQMADYAQECIPQCLRHYFEPDDNP